MVNILLAANAEVDRFNKMSYECDIIYLSVSYVTVSCNICMCVLDYLHTDVILVTYVLIDIAISWQVFNIKLVKSCNIAITKILIITL